MRRKLLILLVILLCFPLYGNRISKSKSVEITADIYLPIELEKLSDVDFGKIPAGAKNIKSQTDGKLKIVTDASLDALKITWKDEEKDSYVEIEKDIEVGLKGKDKEDEKLKSIIKASEDKEGKSLIFTGVIPEVPENFYGTYRGTFIVRVEYK